ncbi:MAG: hypothetical protein KAG28_03725 [Cocleimonas sp.]|nr:hypothetical protein [Cocleimonas sp.]
MKTKLQKALALSLVVIGSSLFATAQAADDKTSSGSTCNAYYGFQQKTIRTIGGNILYVSGASKSRRTQWVKCPLTEDIMAGGSRHNFYLNVYLYHPSNRKTTCYLKRATRGGSGIRTKKIASGKGNKVIRFKFGSSLSHQNSSLYCRLADGPYSTKPSGATRLKSYHWSEQ